MTRDIGDVLAQDSWVYLRAAWISSKVGSMGKNKLYEKQNKIFHFEIF